MQFIVLMIIVAAVLWPAAVWLYIENVGFETISEAYEITSGRLLWFWLGNFHLLVQVILMLVSAVGLWRGKDWARRLWLYGCILYIVYNMVGYLVSPRIGFPLLDVIIRAAICYSLFCLHPKDYFQTQENKT
ncbi:hypothetical protein [Neisseria mucosa]|uniref:hypothetical protein n=1 Tax=Neisseria mucosa TaxID=488 RepID=UPI001438D3DB|nr:hypothetical protein [Neisseria mucosa]